MLLDGITDKGLKRETNQDVFSTHCFSDDDCFAIVCDGMGGSNGGNIASKMACDIIKEIFISRNINLAPKDKIKDIMIDAISEANIKIYTAGLEKKEHKGMGTTVVAAVIINHSIYIVNVGDSRAYIYKGSKLTQVTKDHSLVQELIDKGKLNKNDQNKHPKKNLITRAVGVGVTASIDFLEINISAGYTLLLCSDGLTNMVDDNTIAKVIHEKVSYDICNELVRLANECGGIDNITCVTMQKND